MKTRRTGQMTVYWRMKDGVAVLPPTKYVAGPIDSDSLHGVNQLNINLDANVGRKLTKYAIVEIEWPSIPRNLRSRAVWRATMNYEEMLSE